MMQLQNKNNSFLNSINIVRISFITLLLTVFAIVSCSRNFDEGGVGGSSPAPGPAPSYVNFTLTNSSGNRVDTASELVDGDTYGLSVSPGIGAITNTADYEISYEPADAIVISEKGTNLITFQVKNTAATSVKVTIKHKSDPTMTQVLNLKLPPKKSYINFALTNSSGNPVDPTSELVAGGTYGLGVNPGSDALTNTADYDISYEPADAITIRGESTNLIAFQVKNTGATSVKVTIKHKSNPRMTEVLTLKLAYEEVYMNFTLTNSSGNRVDTASELVDGATYGLSVSPGRDALTNTADYEISYEPADAIAISAGSTNLIAFQVKNTAATSVKVTIKHKSDPTMTQVLSLKLPPKKSYMNFALTNSSGNSIDTTSELADGATYGLSVSPGSDALTSTADYEISYEPADAITISAGSTNLIAFKVENTGATSVKVTIKHKSDPTMTEVLTLKLPSQKSYINFTLTNSSGNRVDTANELADGATYGLSVSPGSDAAVSTADYDISYEPADAITISAGSTNLIAFKVENTAATSLKVTVKHKSDPTMTEVLTLKLPSQKSYINFTLTNSSGNRVDTANELADGATYGLSVNPGSDAVINTADYEISYEPADAIAISAESTNLIAFQVKNTAVTSVKVTIKHKSDPRMTEVLTLKLPPKKSYINFTLTNSSGNPVDPTSELADGDTYGLRVSPGSDAAVSTADYEISYEPADAITIRGESTNLIAFKVENTAVTSLKVTVKHKSDPNMTEVLTLKLPSQKSYMNFVILNYSGTVIDPATTSLFRTGTYQLTVTPGGDAATSAADYTITPDPSTAITTVASSSNFIRFRVNTTPDTTLKFNVVHKANARMYGSLTLTLANAPATTTFANEMQNTEGMPDLGLSSTSALTGRVLKPLGAAFGASFAKRYATETGAGNGDGTSWANAWSAANLRSRIAAISDASADKVYLIMVAGGTYKPGTARGDSFSMKNHVAIMGGFQAGGGWTRGGTTVFSGDIGAVGNTADNSYHVFFHDSINISNSHLYGVTITGGNADGTDIQRIGAGMYNRKVSPYISATVFKENRTINEFGAIGGGMYIEESALELDEVLFTNNYAYMGGGIYTSSSSLVFKNVSFIANAGVENGGAISLNSSSADIIGGVFRGNSGGLNGSDIYMNGFGVTAKLLLVNTVVAEIPAGSGPSIRYHTGNHELRIAGSVLGIGSTSPNDGYGERSLGGVGADSVVTTYYSLNNGAINFGDFRATTEGVSYPTITAGSSAINLGLFVRRSGSTYYFSEDNATWYTGFTTTGAWGSSVTLPAGTEDLTATDITGAGRNGRPDAGVYELQ